MSKPEGYCKYFHKKLLKCIEHIQYKYELDRKAFYADTFKMENYAIVGVCEYCKNIDKTTGYITRVFKCFY